MSDEKFENMSSIDMLEFLARETGTPFRREEKHLELVVNDVTTVMLNTRRELLDKMASLQYDMTNDAKHMRGQLANISAAVWILCLLFAAVAWKYLST